MKKVHVSLLFLGFIFLGYLIWRIGFGRLWSELTSLGWGIALFIGLEFAAEAIHTIAWSHCLDEPYRSLSWLERFRVRMAGNAVGYLTPTAAIGGMFIKAALLSSNHKGPAAISGILVGRLCVGIGHLLFVAAGSVIVLCCVKLPPHLWVVLFLSGGLVATGILAFLLLQKYGQLGAVVRWLAARKFAGQSLQVAAKEINNVDQALKNIYRERPRDVVLAAGWHMIGFSTGFIQTWCFFYLLHQHVPPATIATIFILGMWFDLLTFAVPLNMGTLEGGRIVVFKAVGFGAVMGMTYGLALRLAQLSCAAFGLVNYAAFRAVWRPKGEQTFQPPSANDKLREQKDYAKNV